MGKISAIAKLFGEAAKAEELSKSIYSGIRKGAMTSEEIGELARKSGVTPQQVVRAEKAASSGRGITGYTMEKADERIARLTGERPVMREYFPGPRRELQRSLAAAKKAEPKAYQAMKDWTSAPAGTPAPEEPLRKITSSIAGAEEYHPSWPTDVASRFKEAARRGTLPAAAAAAGGTYAGSNQSDNSRLHRY